MPPLRGCGAAAAGAGVDTTTVAAGAGAVVAAGFDGATVGAKVGAAACGAGPQAVSRAIPALEPMSRRAARLLTCELATDSPYFGARRPLPIIYDRLYEDEGRRLRGVRQATG